MPIAIRPDEAVVTFEGLAGAEGQTWRIGRVVFSSPIGEYDATLVELDRPLGGVEPYPIAKRLPPLGGDPQRVYVVGHPLGGGLSFSLQDNLLLDWDERLGWRSALAGPTAAAWVPGDHHAFMREPHVEATADQISGFLARA